MTGMLEGDYRAVLDALCAGLVPTQPGSQADDAREPSVHDVASLLEFGTSAVHSIAPRTPEAPRRWEAQLRLMGFDMPGVSERPAPTTEVE